MIRVGSKVALHIYDDSLPNDAEHHWQEIAVCHTPEDAARIVAAVNYFDAMGMGNEPEEGRCSTCGGPLVYVAGPNVQAVLCPVCDADSSALEGA